MIASLLVLALAAPASADPGLAASFADLRESVKPHFQRITQESGPNDPFLLAQKGMLDMIDRVEPSIVLIQGGSLCTGFFIDARAELGREGIIATNSHCVENLAVGSQVNIGLHVGNDNSVMPTKGKVLAYGSSERAKDIAFIELVDPGLSRPPLQLWSKLRRGEKVVAIGHPYDIRYTVTEGIISGIGRTKIGDMDILDMNQSDVAVNPGNSGGPLFNMWGSVVGINTAIFTGDSGGFQGISYSLPAPYITLALEQYKRTGNLRIGSMKAALGALADGKNLVVTGIMPGGAAEAAGLAQGDAFLSVDDLDLRGLEPRDAMKSLMAHLKYRSPGETVKMTVLRGGGELVLTMTLGEIEPAPEPKPWYKRILPFASL